MIELKKLWSQNGLARFFARRNGAWFRQHMMAEPKPRFRPKICWSCFTDCDILATGYYVIRGFLPANRTGFPDDIYAERRLIKTAFDNEHPIQQAMDFERAIESIERRLYGIIDDYSEVAAP